MSKSRLIVLILAVMPLLFGCASHPKVDPNINWSDRIGNYTYDQALAELGPPAVIAESSEGRSADWVLKRSPQMSFGFGIGGGTFGSHVGTGVGVGTSISPPPHGEYLHLDFDRDGKLKAWTKVKH